MFRLGLTARRLVGIRTRCFANVSAHGKVNDHSTPHSPPKANQDVDPHPQHHHEVEHPDDARSGHRGDHQTDHRHDSTVVDHHDEHHNDHHDEHHADHHHDEHHAEHHDEHHADHHHGHSEHYDVAGGYLFGVKPGERREREGWEWMYYIFMFGGMAFITVGLFLKPGGNDTMGQWAQQEIKLRKQNQVL